MSESINFQIKSIVNYILFILIMATMQIEAKDQNFPRWHVDESIKIDLGITGNILKITFTNVGDKNMKINSYLLDKKYLLSRVIHVSFVNPDSYRRQLDDFRLASDGIIGVNSESYEVVSLDLLPKESKTVDVDYVDAMNHVQNEKLQKYLLANHSGFRLYLTVDLKDFKIDGNCSLRYTMPEMTHEISQIKK